MTAPAAGAATRAPLLCGLWGVDGVDGARPASCSEAPFHAASCPTAPRPGAAHPLKTDGRATSVRPIFSKALSHAA